MKFRGEEIVTSEWLEPGIHSVVITKIDVSQVYSNKYGKNIEKGRMEFTDRNGKKVTSDYFITDDALWKLKDLAYAIGIDEAADIDWPDFEGKKCSVEVMKESYTKKDGKQGTISVVKSVEPIIDPDGLDELSRPF